LAGGVGGTVTGGFWGVLGGLGKKGGGFFDQRMGGFGRRREAFGLFFGGEIGLVVKGGGVSGGGGGGGGEGGLGKGSWGHWGGSGCGGTGPGRNGANHATGGERNKLSKGVHFAYGGVKDIQTNLHPGKLGGGPGGLREKNPKFGRVKNRGVEKPSKCWGEVGMGCRG